MVRGETAVGDDDRACVGGVEAVVGPADVDRCEGRGCRLVVEPRDRDSARAAAPETQVGRLDEGRAEVGADGAHIGSTVGDDGIRTGAVPAGERDRRVLGAGDGDRTGPPDERDEPVRAADHPHCRSGTVDDEPGAGEHQHGADDLDDGSALGGSACKAGRAKPDQRVKRVRLHSRRQHRGGRAARGARRLAGEHGRYDPVVLVEDEAGLLVGDRRGLLLRRGEPDGRGHRGRRRGRRVVPAQLPQPRSDERGERYAQQHRHGRPHPLTPPPTRHGGIPWPGSQRPGPRRRRGRRGGSASPACSW